jgi:YegS/Rv2252/BmrU family lipid kinase
MYPFEFDVVFTERPSHEMELAREGILRGYDRIISVGGDGTLNGVVNGFFDEEKLIRQDAAVGLLEIGTGADFVKTLGFPSDAEEAVGRLVHAQPQTIDVGQARFKSLQGEPVVRYFVNILDFGIGGAVVERVNRASKRFGGKISFLWAILSALVRYRNKRISYRLDEGEWKTGVLNNFIVANGRYFGSGLLPAPEAKLDDGLLDIVLFGDLGLWDAITNLPRLRAGTHISNPHVHMTRARRVDAESDEVVFIDMDGDLVGRLPISISLLPGVLPVLT